MAGMAAARLLARLAEPGDRSEASARLAAHLGCGEVLLMVRDPVVNAMIPAPGFPRTLRGGPGWSELMQRCLEAGCHAGQVELPRGRPLPAMAISHGGLAVVALGAEALDSTIVDEIQWIMPLLARALVAEQEVALAKAEARDAWAVASRGESLALALDGARRDSARLNEKLRDEHRRKDEFLAMLAHELRNPLAPLVNSIEILRLRASDAELQRLVLIMARQSQHLARLVDDLLDISRVTRGVIELRCEQVAVSQIISHAMEMNRPILEAQRHCVAVHVPERPLSVWGDAVRLTQVVSNLVHNAAKYTPEQGRIRVEARAESGEVVIEVADNGMGIAPPMLETVFELFAQVPEAMDQARGGLGIGLTLVKSLVEMHGGRVSAESPGIGKGTTFRVRLPLHKVVPARAEEPVLR